MSYRQSRYNFQVDMTFANGETSESAPAFSVDIPTWTRPVVKYQNQRKGVILIDGKEDPPEFTVVMDLDLAGVVDANSLDFSFGGTNEVLRKLDSLLDSNGDTVDVTITALERIGGELTATWQSIATDCKVTSIAGDVFSAEDDSAVARCTVTFQPSEIKRLKVVDAS